MDSNEYKLLEIKYSEEDKKRIEQYNNEHIEKALNLCKYNADKLNNDKEYEELELVDRMNFIQSHEDFKEFCKLYPVVSKYIVCFGLFSKKAFKKYIDWISILRPSDEYRAKICQNQREQLKFKNKYDYAMYIKFLYKDKNQRASLSEINHAYLSTVESLNQETDNFFDMYEAEVKIQNEKKELNTEERKNKIINQLKIKLNKT